MRFTRRAISPTCGWCATRLAAPTSKRGRHAEAVAELERCQKRIGEASDVFLDDWPTFRYTVPLKYWLAAAQDGLGLTDSAAKNYKAYLELRGRWRAIALAADARKRIVPDNPTGCAAP